MGWWVSCAAVKKACGWDMKLTVGLTLNSVGVCRLIWQVAAADDVDK